MWGNILSKKTLKSNKIIKESIWLKNQINNFNKTGNNDMFPVYEKDPIKEYKKHKLDTKWFPVISIHDDNYSDYDTFYRLGDLPIDVIIKEREYYNNLITSKKNDDIINILNDVISIRRVNKIKKIKQLIKKVR